MTRDSMEENKTRAKNKFKEATREAKKVVAQAKEKTYEDTCRILDSKKGENDMLISTNEHKLGKERRQDLRTVKFIKDDSSQA